MTLLQIQCLLQYLGYYTITVDGIWGPGSEQATKDFQAAEGLEGHLGRKQVFCQGRICLYLRPLRRLPGGAVPSLGPCLQSSPGAFRPSHDPVQRRPLPSTQ